MNTTKVICFDMDDTLYERSQPFTEACLEVFASKFKLDWNLLFQRRNYYSDLSFEAEATGKISREEMYIFRIAKALEEFGQIVSGQEILYFEERYAYHQQHISLNPGMKSLLDTLAANKIPTGVMTNGPSDRQRMKLHALALESLIPEECWCISGDYDTRKPHKAMFDLSKEKLSEYYRQQGYDDLEFWYVGDNYDNDVEGAKKAGWNCIWYCTSEENRSAYAHASVKPDFIAARPEDIIEFLAL